MKNKLLLLLSAFFLFACSAENTPEKEPEGEKDKKVKDHYSLVIDAGSSGSRIYVYHIVGGHKEKLPTIEFIDQTKVEPGVSTFMEHPEMTLSQMGELLEFAKTQIDEDLWKETPLYLMATAGMRLLSEDDQNETMDQITDYFKKNSVFDFKEAITLSGQYESLYGWAALNYLDDAFDSDTERESLLEMGGASTQIAFLTNESTTPDILNRNYGGTDYNIYTKSYLNMGQDRALELAGGASCYPAGYPLGNETTNGNFALCSEQIIPIFNKLCDSLEVTDCLFNSGFKANDENEYIAIAAFYYTLDFFGFEETVNLDSLEARGTRFCEKTWATAQAENASVSASYLKSYCFYSSYFWTLFKKGYGLNEEFTIKTMNEIDDSEISWTLGAVIDLEMGYKPEKH